MPSSAKHELPPSQKPFWIGGHFRPFRKDATGFLLRQAKLGDVSSFKMVTLQGFFINHPDLIRDMLVVSAHKFIKGRALQRAKSLLGEGLLTSEREFHLRQRRMIQPAFHRGRIAEYARIMIEHGEKMSDSWQDGEIRDIDREMMHLTLQIVGRTLFSADVENAADAVGKAITSMVELFNFLLLPYSEWLEKLPIPQTRRFLRAKDTLDSVIYGMINERRRSGENKGDLLSMLLEAQDEDDGGVMTDEQVRDEALTLFLAGHETTANALTWTWYLLSQNPEAEAKLHEELGRVLEPTTEVADSFGDTLPTGRVSALRVPTLEDLGELKYTEAVLAESMRLYPPAWALGRTAVEDHEFGGYRVPKGSLVLCSPFVMHRDPRFWENADEFRPERWEKLSVKEAGQQNIYFPFGGGVRRCIGEGFAWMEGVLLLATLARKWKMSLTPEQIIGTQPMMVLRPKFGMRMQIEAVL